jgi:MFS family permease
MAFITRALLLGRFAMDFNLDPVETGRLFGAGLWPFAISIILFSLIIDKVGYRKAMLFSFVCYAIYGLLAFIAYARVHAEGLTGAELTSAQASGHRLLWWGSVILGLGNGTVEAFINPVVATLFNKAKTKWLNILHAGWPGGLVLGGVVTIALGGLVQTGDWRFVITLVLLPAIVYLVILLRVQFPVNERVASGTSYREMLSQFGAIGCFIASYLIANELLVAFSISGSIAEVLRWGLPLALSVAYGIYCGSLGRPLMIALLLIMMPLATTELGVDGAITVLMENAMSAVGVHAGWVLVYTSAIMMILRLFSAGFLVKMLGPVGLLLVCSLLAATGLYLLSSAGGLGLIFIAASIYGIGKTFFWPTMLGIVSEQCPKGGALTLNAIAGIGMLTVGAIGSPLVGLLTASVVNEQIRAQLPQYADSLMVEKDFPAFPFITYDSVEPARVDGLPQEAQASAASIIREKSQDALSRVVIFPLTMAIAYGLLLLFFRSRGGYRPVQIMQEKVKEGELPKHVAEA